MSAIFLSSLPLCSSLCLLCSFMCHCVSIAASLFPFPCFLPSLPPLFFAIRPFFQQWDLSPLPVSLFPPPSLPHPFLLLPVPLLWKTAYQRNDNTTSLCNLPVGVAAAHTLSSPLSNATWAKTNSVSFSIYHSLFISSVWPSSPSFTLWTWDLDVCVTLSHNSHLGRHVPIKFPFLHDLAHHSLTLHSCPHLPSILLFAPLFFDQAVRRR